MALTKATQNVLEGIVSTGSTGVSAGSFIVAQQYKITALGTTTQTQWNTIAGTTGQTYVVGSLFTAATTGSGSGNGAAAVARTLANRFSDFVSPLDFGAVGDGSTNDLAAVKLALESGRPVDGNGRTYGISGSCTPTSIVGLQNANFIQLAPTTASVATINIIDKSDFFIDNVKINMGSVENTGASDDSSKSGLRIVSSNENTLFNENFRITRVTVTGNGNGSRIQIRSGKRFTVDNCLVTDCIAAYSPDPTNDIMNGFDIGSCANFTVSNCSVYNLLCVIGGTPIVKWTRGFLFTEVRDCTIIGCNSTSADQCYDFSGAVSDSSPSQNQGNRRFTISGCTANNAGILGFAFKNVTHDGIVTGCIANNPGFSGFFFGSQSLAIPLNPSKQWIYYTSRINVSNCKVVNSSGSGFRIDGNNNPTTPWPNGIRIINCEVTDTNSPITTVDAYSCQVTLPKTPQFGYNKSIANTIEYCSASEGISFNGSSNNFGPNIALIAGTGNQSIPNGNSTLIGFDKTINDPQSLHNTSVTNTNVYIKTPGNYKVSANIQFAANATGLRKITIAKNGIVPINEYNSSVQGTASSPTTISINGIMYCNSGDAINIYAFQNSGVALNIDLTNSYLLIEKSM